MGFRIMLALQYSYERVIVMKGKGKPIQQIKPPKMTPGMQKMQQAMMNRKSGRRGQ